MPALTLSWKKKRDGTIVFRCDRADGTATWQHGDRNAAFYALHDMTHYAIETTLGLTRAFYGLVASGWDLTDFGTPWPRGHFPPDAAIEVALAEHLAGAFDLERAARYPILAEEFNAGFAAHCATAGVANPRPIAEDELTQIRAKCRELMGRWMELPEEETLSVSFPLSK